MSARTTAAAGSEIDNSDFRSKQVFSFIIQLLHLAQTTNAQSLPVITIPSG